MKLIKNLLDNNKIEYKVFEYDLTLDKSKLEESNISCAIKSIILKTEEGKFILALVSVNRKIDLKILAKIHGTKSLYLATQEEVLKKTGCEIGGCHPFGTLSKLITYMDKTILDNDIVEFNVGLPNMTIQMKSKDLTNLINPQIEDFSAI